MKFLQLSVTGVIWRFYLMMALVIIAGFTGLWFLAILALPLFFTALMGISFEKKLKAKAEAKTQSRVAQPDSRTRESQVTATAS